MTDASAAGSEPMAWDSLRAHADTLSEEQRARVTQEWTRAAQMEHASIASFDRFALQLIALGAPPELLSQTHQAAIDEIRHARLAFAVASIYARQSLGPGPLLLSADAFANFSMPFVLRSAVEEGCVGETLAAAEALAASERVTHPVLRRVLSEIANDEAEHAALAYRFASWALGTFGAEGRAAIESGFASLATLSVPSTSTGDDAWLEAHGRLSSSTQQSARGKAIVEVVRPAQRSLLGA